MFVQTLKAIIWLRGSSQTNPLNVAYGVYRTQMNSDPLNTLRIGYLQCVRVVLFIPVPIIVASGATPPSTQSTIVSRVRLYKKIVQR
jgi:hypothetical protein